MRTRLLVSGRWRQRACRRCECPVVASRRSATDLGGDWAGSLAPCSIQRRSTLFSSADSGSSGFGGISSFETRSQSVLSSRLPGTTTGPLDPPRASDRGLLRLSFPLGLSGLWHFRHRAFKSGSTSRSKAGCGCSPDPNAGRRKVCLELPQAQSSRVFRLLFARWSLPLATGSSTSTALAILPLSGIARRVHNPRAGRANSSPIPRCPLYQPQGERSVISTIRGPSPALARLSRASISNTFVPAQRDFFFEHGTPRGVV